MSATVWLLLALLVLVCGWFVLVWRAALRSHELDWRGASRLIVLAVLGVGAAIWLYGGAAVSGVQPGAASGIGTGACRLAGVGTDIGECAAAGKQLALRAGFPRPMHSGGNGFTWPAGRAQRAFRFNARQAADDKAPRIVVMVLGESSRADRWSLNGYDRVPTRCLSWKATW